MNFANTQTLLIAYVSSNIIGLLLLWAAVKKPKIARISFFLLFGWASWTNYNTCHQHPEFYLDYSQHAIEIYKDFINGWFKDHITAMVTLISIGQAMISIGMLLKGIFVKLSCIGAIVFLLCIAPLGLYAAFPFSIIVSLAAYFIIKKDNKNYLWKRPGQ